MKSLSGSRGRNIAGKHNSRHLFTLAIVLLAFSSLPRVAAAGWVAATRAQMGTEVRVYLWHDDEEQGHLAANAVFAEIARIESVMSTYMDDSEISAINRNAAEEPVLAGDELYELIVRSLEMSVMTGGAFDITYDSVGQYYDFRAGIHPDKKTLQNSLPQIDYRLVEPRSSDHSIRFLAPGVRINLGGIAKGYAVERGVDILRSFGVRNAIVTAGGDSRLLGDRRGQPWVVGIQDPRSEEQVALRIPLVDEAVSTSGDYERYFLEDGKRYHHIIAPSTGEPAKGMRSATIVGPDAVLTDALSTSVFIMGVDSGLRLIASLPDYEGIVIDAEGRLFYSDGLQPPAPD